ncbi:hypothetical protein Y032_0073g758 [Ancylostoma ceylanicum]|uniref:Uncharacterized protein n=1 Tax=Ancylostoma ceylanicum TaxID=53326 RepID=A0A016TVV7_9BILA|nr:hypothetical protein Y032_0073g758 [Ancylostoma ceylanicum]
MKILIVLIPSKEPKRSLETAAWSPQFRRHPTVQRLQEDLATRRDRVTDDHVHHSHPAAAHRRKAIGDQGTHLLNPKRKQENLLLNTMI